jgi:hypothetical protein
MISKKILTEHRMVNNSEALYRKFDRWHLAQTCKPSKMNINPKIWVQTINIWSSDFYAIPNCPNCRVGILELNDQPTMQTNVIRRHAKCNNCGITETFTMPTPDYPGYKTNSN